MPVNGRKVRKVMVLFECEDLEILDGKAKECAVSRNSLVVQIVRKYLGFPSLLKESN